MSRKHGTYIKITSWCGPFVCLGSILSTFVPQTTLIVKAQKSHIRALLHNNNLLIKIIIIILTIYNMGIQQ